MDRGGWKGHLVEGRLAKGHLAVWRLDRGREQRL